MKQLINDYHEAADTGRVMLAVAVLEDVIKAFDERLVLLEEEIEKLANSVNKPGSTSTRNRSSKTESIETTEEV